MKTRILVVDDDRIFTAALKKYLMRVGNYDVMVANDSVRALSVARAYRPELVILDIVMPECDGATIAAQMRGDITLREIPIVFMTGLVTHQELTAVGSDIGGNTFLAKPAELSHVLDTIERILQTANAGAR